MSNQALDKAKAHFAGVVEEQLARIERMKAQDEWIDYGQVDPIKIGILGGDGIGPYIAEHARSVLEFLLEDELRSGKVEFNVIDGLTIENRAEHNQSVPDDVLAEIKTQHILLKGPTTTPRKGDPWPNIESCNVSLRRYLDLFANVRPVKVPSEGIDWVFFRENTEGAYVLGSSGINVTDDLAVDFTVATSPGSERIIRLAFEYAKKNNIKRVTAVTKANVIKTTDGKFLSIAQHVAGEYPDIEFDDWYIDIMT
ncbi:MAG: isocitrate/isopropylmalate family dehydrogenase, partial [Candidatus Krumholzibacteria bacterium]|nr:isocitrate/isopropylmalate family dehydrogenase [Candidatus Krumholzibacteria bacterium]